jgi:hypothetical protein
MPKPERVRLVLLSVTNRSVIPTEAKRNGVKSLRPRSFLRSKQKCHPDRSEAKWRDLLFIIRNIESEWERRPPLCHPDRSVAEWRDLQFNGPLLEMFHQFKH